MSEEQEIDDFFKCLKYANTTEETRKEIVRTHCECKDLLMLTGNELQKQRLKLNKLSNVHDNLIFFILPYSNNSVNEALGGLSDDGAKKRQIQACAGDNKNEFRRELEIFLDALKDKNGKDCCIREIPEKCEKIQNNLVELLEQVKHDSDEAKKIGVFTGSAILVASVLAAVYACTARPSGGGAAFRPLLFAGAGLGFIFGSLTMNGARTRGSTFIPEPSIFKVIGKIKEETTNIINGLKTMESQFSIDDIMLYLSWEENTNEAVIHSEKNSLFEKNVEKFVTDLQASKKNFDKFVDNIKKTEVIVSSELDSFTESIYAPLLSIYQ